MPDPHEIPDGPPSDPSGPATFEARYRALREAASRVTWTTTANGEFVEEQPDWAGLTGQTFAQYRGWGWLDALHPDDRDATGRAWRSSVRSGTVCDVAYRVRRADGVYRWFRVRAAPVRTPDGSIAEWVGVETDITDHRHALAEAVHARDAAEEQATELERQTEELQLQSARLAEAQGELERINGEMRQANERLTRANDALQAAGRDAASQRRRLEAVLQHLPSGVVIAEAPSGRLIMGNARMEEIWGHPFLAAATVGDYTGYHGFRPDGTPLSAGDWPLARSVLHGEVVRAEAIEIVRGDGTRALISVSSAPVRDDRGEITAAVVSFEDVTDEKRAAEALRASEERFRLITETIREVFYVSSVDPWEMQYVSPAYEEIWGRPRETLYDDPSSVLAAIHPDDRRRVEAALERQMEGEVMELEYRIVRSGGETRWIQDRAYPIRDASGRVRRIVGVAEDVTRDKFAERELRDREERLRLAARATNDAIWDWDLRTGQVIWNEALADRFGWTEEAAHGTDADWWKGNIHPDDRERVIASIHAVIDGGGAHWSGEYRFGESDGGWAEVLDRGYVVRDEHGAPLRIIGAMQDLSERHRMQRALDESRVRVLSIIENISDGFYVLDTDWRFTEFNAEAESYFARSRDEVLGQSFWDVFAHTAGTELEQRFREAMRTRSPQHFEARSRFTGRWMEMHTYPSEEGMAVFFRDVTETRRVQEALRESEERFRTMADDAPVMVWVTEPDGTCTYLNRRWYEFTGQTAEHGLGFGWLDAVHPDDRPRTEQDFVTANATQSPFQTEYRLRRHDGQYRWAIDAAKPRLSPDGDYLGYIGSVVDIHERKLAEELAEAERARLATVVAQFPIPVALFDGPRHVVVAASEAYERITGGRAVLGRAFADIFPELHDQGFLDRLDTVYRTGVGWEASAAPVQWDVTGDGNLETHFVDIVYHPVRAAGGAVTGILAAVQVVDEREHARRSQEFLAEASGLLALSLDEEVTLARLAEMAVPALADWSAVDLLEPDGRIRRVAIAHTDPDRRALAEELVRRWPYRIDDSTGIGAVIRTGEAELAPEITDQMLEAGSDDPERLEMTRRLGLRSYVVVPLETGGERLGALTLVQGASGRRLDARALNLARDVAGRAAAALQNARLYRDAERARAEAEEANQAKSQFLATMSHELRTPLNAIVGYSDLLSMGIAGPVTEGQAMQVERIRASSRHLLTLINDILDLAKVESGQLEIAAEPVSLAEPLEQAVAVVEHQAEQRRLRIGSEPAPGAELAVVGDADRVRQILVNLLSNAVKFTEPGGRIRISARRADSEHPGARAPRGPCVRLDVEDTGVGIAPERLSEIFDPFVQVDSRLTREHQGTGLGLTISRHLARLMHGDLTVQSRPGEGSVFTLWLPAAERPRG